MMIIFMDGFHKVLLQYCTYFKALITILKQTHKTKYKFHNKNSTVPILKKEQGKCPTRPTAAQAIHKTSRAAAVGPTQARKALQQEMEETTDH